MNKTERLSVIESLIKHSSAGSLQVDKSGIEQEAQLAKANDSDESILDEEVKGADFISPMLAGAVEKARVENDKEENFLLTKKDLELLSRELGRPVSFTIPKKNEDGDEEFANKTLDYDELSRFAREQEIAMDKADAENKAS